MEAKIDDLVAILLVEDEKIALQLLAAILIKKYPGIALHSAVNGRAGLELFREHALGRAARQLVPAVDRDG